MFRGVCLIGSVLVVLLQLLPGGVAAVLHAGAVFAVAAVLWLGLGWLGLAMEAA